MMADGESSEPPQPPIQVIGWDKPPPPRRRRPRYLTAVVAGLVGGAIGFLLGNLPPTTPSSSPEPSTSAPATMTGVEGSLANPLQTGLAELVPGWTGTLHAVTRTSQGTVNLTSWSSGRPPTTSASSPGGADVDIGGTLFAALESSATSGNALMVGNLYGLMPAALNVTAMAWHTEDPGRLAWIEDLGGGTGAVRTGSVDVGGGLTVDLHGSLAVPDTWYLTDWGDWGYVFHHRGSPTDRTLMLDLDGEEVWEHRDASPWTTSRHGRSVVADANHFGPPILLIQSPSASTAPTALPSLEGSEYYFQALWSPVGKHLAVTTEAAARDGRRLLVYRTDGTLVLNERLPLEPSAITWGSDDRFVVVAFRFGRQLMFFDIVTGAITEVPVEGLVTRLFVN